jgi:hypothetical protein
VDYALAKAGGAPAGGSVTVAAQFATPFPMVLTVGNSGAVDVFYPFSLAEPNRVVWTREYDAHTQSFGAAIPGAPIAAAQASIVANARTFDFLVAGPSAIVAAHTGGDTTWWSRPGLAFR